MEPSDTIPDPSSKDALKRLGINDFRERVYNSNSHGELFHLMDYAIMSDMFKDEELPLFRPWFLSVVEWAEKTWSRPESVFQHILKFAEQTRKTEAD
jgi:hypothetical protein